jgi:chemotaxis protein MotA
MVLKSPGNRGLAGRGGKGGNFLPVGGRALPPGDETTEETARDQGFHDRDFRPFVRSADLAGHAGRDRAGGPVPEWRRVDGAGDIGVGAAVLKIDQVAQLRGLSCTDRVKTASPFLTDAARKLANCDRTDMFELWAVQTLADRAQRHGAVHKVWLSIADAAPALGMAGTIVGLVGMFAAMDDPAALGPSMALALLTTFYGVVIANIIAAPIAARLADLSERELAWQREAADRMLAIARRENAPLRRASIREVA